MSSVSLQDAKLYTAMNVAYFYDNTIHIVGRRYHCAVKGRAFLHDFSVIYLRRKLLHAHGGIGTYSIVVNLFEAIQHRGRPSPS